MERRAHRQQHRALRAPRLRRRHRALDRFAVAGDDDLIGRVEIHRLDHLALRRFATRVRDAGIVEAHDRRHRPDARRHGFLHRLRAETHQRQRVGECQRAAGDQRRVFAQAVAGEQRGRAATRGAPGAIHRDARREHDRLRVDGQIERVVAGLDQRPEVLPERRGGLGERVAHDRKAAVAAHHARRLRALPGKHQSEFHRPFTSATEPIPT